MDAWMHGCIDACMYLYMYLYMYVRIVCIFVSRCDCVRACLLGFVCLSSRQYTSILDGVHEYNRQCTRIY